MKLKKQQKILIMIGLILFLFWLSKEGYLGRKVLTDGYIYYDDFEIPFDTTDNNQLISLHSETSDFSITCKSQGNCGSAHPGYYIDRCTYGGKDAFGCDIWYNYYQSISELDYSDKGTIIYGGVDTSSGTATRQFNVDLTNDIKLGSHITKAFIKINYDNMFTCTLNDQNIVGGNRIPIDMTAFLINGQNALTCNKPFEAWIYHDSDCIEMCNPTDTSQWRGAGPPQGWMPKQLANTLYPGLDCGYRSNPGYTECASDKWLYKDTVGAKYAFSNGWLSQPESWQCAQSNCEFTSFFYDSKPISTPKNFDGRSANLKIATKVTAACRGSTSNPVITFPGGAYSPPNPISCSCFYPDYACGQPVDYFIEIMHEPSDDTITYLYLNGRLEKTFTHADIDTLDVAISLSGGDWDYLAWKPVFGCQQGPQDLLGMETLNAGDTISLYSTRYPVKRLCYEHLPILTKAGQTGSTVSPKIYNDLAQGLTYEVKSDETITLFYIFYNDGSIKMTCENEAYDFNNNRCTNLTGVVYFCSAGTFDPAVGSCVVTPEQKIWCEYGRYDTAQMKCIYNPPIQAVCETGDYNSISGKCEWKPAVEPVCGDATYNPLTKMCEVFPIKTIICEPGFAYNAITDKCEKYVDSEIKCINGTYTDGKCIKEVEPTINNICKQGVLYQNPTTFVYSCIIEPEYKTGTCMSGSWNGEMNACVIQPDLDYLCINGVLNENKTACLIIPKTVVICPTGTTYDIATNQCLRGGDGGTVVAICPEGSYYNSNTKKCIIGDVINNTIAITTNVSWLCNEDEIYDETRNICIGKQVQDRTALYIAGVIITLLIYFLWEKGPKSGFFRR